jgi:hypothetical protein
LHKFKIGVKENDFTGRKIKEREELAGIKKIMFDKNFLIEKSVVWW